MSPQYLVEVALQEWQEEVDRCKAKNSWVPEEVAASKLRRRWGSESDKVGHVGGVQPGAVFNHRAQTILSGLHGHRSNMFWSRNNQVLAIMLGPLDLPACDTKGCKTLKLKEGLDAVGASLFAKGDGWAQDKEKLIVHGTPGVYDSAFDDNLWCKGTAASLVAAHKDRHAIRVVREVHMVPRDKGPKKGKDLVFDRWYVYLGLFTVAAAHKKKWSDEVAGVDKLWRTFELQGVPGEHVTQDQLQKLAKFMRHNIPLGIPDKRIFLSFANRVPKVPAAPALKPAPAPAPLSLTTLTAAPPAPVESTGAAAGAAQGAAFKAESEMEVELEQPPSPAALMASEWLADVGLAVDGGAAGAGPQEPEPKAAARPEESNEVDAKAKRPKPLGKPPASKKHKPAPEQEGEAVAGAAKLKPAQTGAGNEPLKLLSMEEEKRQIQAWKEALPLRRGLVRRDVIRSEVHEHRLPMDHDRPAMEQQERLPLPLINDSESRYSEQVPAGLTFTYINDYTWAEDSYQQALPDLKRLDDITMQTAGCAQARRESDAEWHWEMLQQDAWWKSRHGRSFCATLLHTALLEERLRFENRPLSDAEHDTAAACVCPFDQRGIMDPAQAYPQVIHQCSAECNEFPVLCSQNKQVLRGPTLPLEVFWVAGVTPASGCWAVRCAVPIPEGRFVCCILGELRTYTLNASNPTQAALPPHMVLLGHLQDKPQAQDVPMTGPEDNQQPSGSDQTCLVTVIDMRRSANLARLIRAPIKPAKANLRRQVVYAGGCRSVALHYIALVAAKDIPAGQELTFDPLAPA